MTYGIFPKQKSNPQFMEAYKRFLEAHHEEYNENATKPDYQLHVRDNDSDRFLVYMPEPSMLDWFTSSTQNFIIYVHFDVIPEYNLSERGKVISNPKTNAHYLRFSFDAPEKFVFEEMYRYVQGVDYEKIDKRFFTTKKFVKETGKFTTFNSACVFQLQPEHYHYFAEFFKDFVPFQKMYPAYRQRIFKSTQLPKNTLLN